MTRISDQSYRGFALDSVDFTGATFRDCGFSGVKAVDCNLTDLRLSGEIRGLVVNDVDVAAFVEGELDRLQPERVQLRAVRSPEDFRAMWVVIEERWTDAVDRAGRLPEAARHQRVEDEWSFVETMRHLIFATDAWVARTILDQEDPFHRLGLPYTGYDSSRVGIEPDAAPSFAEVVAVRAERWIMVRTIVAGLTDAELARPCHRPPAPGYPDEVRSVEACLRVVMNEEVAHLRYATRNLVALEALNSPEARP